MFATDFLFNHNRASDLGLIIGSFDGDFHTATGGDIEYTVIKAPNDDRFNFYGSQLNTVITWNFSVIKNPCLNNGEYYFNQYEESQIAQWLLKQDGYRWFQFDQDGYKDIYYKVYINILPHQIGGRTAGFDLTVTSDCGYGYSEEMIKTFKLNRDKSIKLAVHSDISGYILPVITLTGTGNFCLDNQSDALQKPTKLENVTGKIVLNGETEVIKGISSPNDFNWYFLRLVNGENQITTNSENEITMQMVYREPRRVII